MSDHPHSEEKWYVECVISGSVGGRPNEIELAWTKDGRARLRTRMAGQQSDSPLLVADIIFSAQDAAHLGGHLMQGFGARGKV